ncbi:anthranilate phosphoribosyltransferase [Paenibacillus sp. DXFW5]|uniref:Anthranilate phosphoribosyltransferase n=1 Tax=Paenibacillus rhizolycopersici TaxID=2780073 RepID=A0ABS2H249_9BACL|nr:anthranilate phosphoribosyltransferase [Paenibacillus rhizolycopersici]MBM6995500.1 anthranilate phosphoribosyltransferase [Paenibacillus rhizolycopersici]
MTTGQQTVQAGISRLIEGQHLAREEARRMMQAIMNGESTPAQIGSLLTALRIKGETVEEITGFAEAMRGASSRIDTETQKLLDTCGTGGSGIHKINVSTTAAIVAASVSVRVAKHGNRSASGRSGSADVLEALGVNIQLDAGQAKRCLDNIGICFMFSQLYHPSMKHAAGPRKELGIRTVFNMLGPLTNPAGADRQVLGIYDGGKTSTIAEVLRELGSKRALVVSSREGLDEISISSPTRVSELKNGEIRTYDLQPEDLGLRTYPLEAMIGGDPLTNAEIVRRVLQGAPGAHRDVVLANAGACVYVAGLADNIREGVAIAAEAIDSGKALNKLEQLIQTTEELSYVS